MGNVIPLPPKRERLWRLLEPEYRTALIGADVAGEHIQPILDELKTYFLSCTCHINPTLEVPPSADLSSEQLETVQAEFHKSSQDTLRRCTAQFMAAMSIVLRLIVQKHQSGFGEGSGEVR